MIDIAIVTSAIPPRKTARRETDTAGETRTGSIWMRRKDKIRRLTIECTTAAGVRLELQAFFERLIGKSIRLHVIEPVYADKTIAPAVTSLVVAPVHAAPHGFKQFLKSKYRKDGFTPFTYGFGSQAHIHFWPAWYSPPEPPILLRSSAGDHFTYPATDGDDVEPIDDGRAFPLLSDDYRKNFNAMGVIAKKTRKVDR